MTVAATPASPWKGLAPFEDTALDALLFFGRDREQQVIASNLIAARLTVLYGPSGVGKSSVLRAGVAYHLRAAAERAIEERGHPDLAVVVFDDWRGEPVADLRLAVEEELGRLFGPYALPEVDADATLATTFAAWTRGLDCELLVILDQVEEYFVYHPDEDEDEPFADELPELVTARGIRVNVLLSLREDALAKLDRFKARIPNVFSNYLRLDRLPRAAARAAVLGPLERYNELVDPESTVEIEPAFVEAVIEQTTAGRVELQEEPRGGKNGGDAGEGIETAYLQLVLARIWEDETSSGSRTLRLETLEAHGGAGEIVRSHVRRALDSLDPDERDVAATIFNYLVTPSGTKIAHSLGDLEKYSEGRPDAVDGVVAALSRERVLRSVAAPGEGNGHSSGYEIFHDVLADPILAWRRRHEEERALEQERREGERRQRRAVLVSAVAFAALALMTAVAVYALLERGHARNSERAATARALSAQALTQLDVDQQRALRLAVAAAELEPTRQTEDVLRQALLTARQRRTLRTNGRPALVGYSPNGRFLLTAKRDGQASLWDAATGRSLRRIRIDAPLVDAEFAPSANRILTAGASTVSVSQVASSHPVWTATRKAGVEDAGFSDSGEGVVTTWADRALLVKRSRDGKQLMAFRLGGVGKRAVLSRDGATVAVIEEDRVGHLRAVLYRDGHLVRRLPELGVSDIAFSPDGSILAVASRKHTTSVWRVSTGAPVWKRDDEGGPVVDATFSPNGEMLATASSDGGVRVWTVATGERTFFFLGHKNPVSRVAFDPSSSLLASASADHTVRVWQTLGVEAGLGVAILTGHRGAVTDVAFSPNGRSLATVSDDGTARVWDVRIEQELALVGDMGGEVREALFRPNGSIVAVGSRGAAVFSSAVREGSRHMRAPVGSVGLGARVRLSGRRENVTDVDVSRDGRLLVAAGNLVHLLDRDGEPIATRPHEGTIVRARFAARGNLLLAAGRRTVQIWKALPAPSRARIAPVETLVHDGDVADAAFSPDGGRVVTASTDGALRIWDARTGELEHTLLGHRGRVVRVRWSPRGGAIVSAGTDATARLWSANGVRLHTLRGHDQPLTDARFDPTARRVVTTSLGSSANRNVIEWDARTGRRLHALVGHFHSVQTASFSPDGRWIVTAGPIAAAVWPADTGRLLFYLRGHSDLLTDAEWAPTGYGIVTAARDGTVRTYQCEVCRPLDGLIQLAKARLAGLEARG